MKGKNFKKDTQVLKENILKKEHKREYHCDKFNKIEKQVKMSLENQKADEALRDLTIGAIFLRASDIHYEIFEKYVGVRFRIDGVLVDIFNFSFREYKLILERLKYASGLKLNITLIPQDGKYSMYIDNRKIDVRISTLPTPFGEHIVSRILDNSKSILSFKDLGFFWTSERILKKSISKKNGMILVTGPTGSGKTTTLYSILNKLNSREKKIISLEDPIEYTMQGISQSEIDEKNGFLFGNGLRAALRQDPDIIMVGEIRDKETLEVATQASLTGHLVLSTLHTKSAGETLDRIINMGLKPYIIASAIDTIIAQRLVRKICNDCKVEKEKTPEEKSIIDLMMKDIGMNLKVDNIKLYEGKGCEKCANSGFSGRIGIYEVISINNNLRNIIRNSGTAQDIIKEARGGDFINMKEDGILKAIKGYTSIEEILRVV